MNKIYSNLFSLLKKTKRITFLIKTGSMFPLILPKDKVSVETIPINKIKINDIIAFYSKKIDKIVVHRVVNIENKKIKTKADASSMLDKIIVTNNNYLGKIISIEKKLSKRKNKIIYLNKKSFYWLKYNFKIKNYRKILNKIFTFLFL